MKIAINAWFYGQLTTGSGQYLHHLLAQYTTRYTNHSYLLCGYGADQPTLNLGESFEWRTLRTPLDRVHPKLAKVWFEQIAFPLACKRWQADVAHTPYWASPLFGAIPNIVTIHDLIPILLPQYQGGTLGRVYNALVSTSARRAARVLTDSEASRQDIIQHLEIAPSRVETVLLATKSCMQPVKDAEILKRIRHCYELPDKFLLYLGGFDVRKNVAGILRAWAQLGDLPDDVHLVIAGKVPAQDSAFFPNPTRIVHELGIEERVHLTGRVDEADKPALYSAALAFLFPSFYEGFGLPPLEAISCGTPAIVSERGSLPEVVGSAGLCVDAEDTESLAEAMRHIVHDEALRETLSIAGLAQAERFSWEKAAEQTMEAYRNISPCKTYQVAGTMSR